MYAKVALIQHNIEWESVDRNLRTIEDMIDNQPSCDLYVLPETFATGFATDPTKAAEAEEAIVEVMQRIAKRHNCAICGTLIVRRRERFRNCFLFVMPDRSEHYDKRHLFSIGGEGDEYEAGIERKIVEWRGIRYLLATCYDLRFPVWLRNRGDYDAMICVASWPAARAEVWSTLLRARAIENVAYVIGVNRVGNDPTTHYEGGSTVFDFRGQQQTNAAEQIGIFETQLDTDTQSAFRCKFPVEHDADDFELFIKER